MIELSISDLQEKIQKRDIKIQTLAETYLNRTKALNPKINAFITLNEGVIDQAKKLDRALEDKKDVGVLAGIPLGIKDLFCTKGLRTTAGSKILDNFIPPYSATILDRLENNGALVLGKTNMDEFAMGSSNENSAYGITKNPYDLERVPGGSSGGSAAAVASGCVPASIGSDTGGSIRQPASYCNLVGLKPTYGRISRYGMIAFASSLDQAGPMTKTVKDAALLLEVMAGHDPKDATTAKRKVPSFSKNLSDNLKGVVVGRPIEYFEENIDGEILSTVEKATEILRAQGARIIDVSVPSVKFGISIYYLIATSEASSNLARFDGIRYGRRSPRAKNIRDLYAFSRGEGFGPEVKRRIMLGTYALSSGYYDEYYIKACRARRLLQRDFLDAFKSCSMLISPVTPYSAFKIGEQISDPLAMYLSDIHTISTNLAGLPGISVPAAFSKNGLPIGVQLTAAHFDEQTILNGALAIEKSNGLEKRIADVSI